MRWRRAIAISFLIGAISTTLIAWACATWSELSLSEDYEVLQLPPEVAAHVPREWSSPAASLGEGITHYQDEGPGVLVSNWACGPRYANGGKIRVGYVRLVEAGLPLRSLR